jgi:hypothetical protein
MRRCVMRSLVGAAARAAGSRPPATQVASRDRASSEVPSTVPMGKRKRARGAADLDRDFVTCRYCQRELNIRGGGLAQHLRTNEVCNAKNLGLAPPVRENAQATASQSIDALSSTDSEPLLLLDEDFDAFAGSPVRNASPRPTPSEDSLAVYSKLERFIRGTPQQIFGPGNLLRPDGPAILARKSPRVARVELDPRAGFPLDENGTILPTSRPPPTSTPFRQHDGSPVVAGEFLQDFGCRAEFDLHSWISESRRIRPSVARNNELLGIVKRIAEVAASHGDPDTVLKVQSVESFEALLDDFGITADAAKSEWKVAKFSVTLDKAEYEEHFEFYYRDGWELWKEDFARLEEEVILGPVMMFTADGQRAFDGMETGLFGCEEQVGTLTRRVCTVQRVT